jgi:nitrite reductase/ring-hydroxylating ferredoxin subunit
VRAADVAEGRSLRLCLEDHDIALWRIQGQLHAIANTCPHQHVAALHTGTVEGRCITCPMHGWTFSLETGLAVRGSGRVRVYPVSEVDGWVHVSVPAEDQDA